MKSFKIKFRYVEKTSNTFILPSPYNTSVLYRKNKKGTNTTPYDIHSSEQTLPRHMRIKLAQLRTNKLPLLQSYLHTVSPNTYTPQSSLCLSHTHVNNHLFNCNQVPAQHNTTIMWKKPLEAAKVIQEWESRLASLRD